MFEVALLSRFGADFLDSDEATLRPRLPLARALMFAFALVVIADDEAGLAHDLDAGFALGAVAGLALQWANARRLGAQHIEHVESCDLGVELLAGVLVELLDRAARVAAPRAIRGAVIATEPRQLGMHLSRRLRQVRAGFGWGLRLRRGLKRASTIFDGSAAAGGLGACAVGTTVLDAVTLGLGGADAGAGGGGLTATVTLGLGGAAGGDGLVGGGAVRMATLPLELNLPRCARARSA